MYNLMFVHAPDVFDEGPLQVVRNMAEMANIKTVTVGVNSYGERSHYAFGLLPHNPKRLTYTNEKGVVYFRPDKRFYKDIIPIQSTEYKDRDVLEELSKLKRKIDFKLGIWFYVLMDPRLAESEQYSIKDIYGNPLRSALCPSNPYVREYLYAQLKNMAKNYDIDFIELDTLRYAPINFESNEYFVTFMLQGCFCEYCRQKAKKMGYDVEEIEGGLKALIERRGKMPLDLIEFTNRNIEGLYDNRYYLIMHHLIMNKSFLGFQKMRIDIINDLHKEIYPLLKGMKNDMVITTYHQRTDHAWYFGQDHDTVSKIYDYVLIACYTRETQRIKYELTNAKFLMSGNAKLIATLKLTPQQCFSVKEVEDQIRSAYSVGIDGLAIYDYGWMPLEHIKKAGEIIKDIESK